MILIIIIIILIIIIIITMKHEYKSLYRWSVIMQVVPQLMALLDKKKITINLTKNTKMLIIIKF